MHRLEPRASDGEGIHDGPSSEPESVRRTGEDGPSFLKGWRLAITVGTVAFLAALGAAPFDRTTSQIVTDLVQLALCVLASIALVKAAFHARALDRWFWALIASSVVVWALGQLFWTLHLQGLSSSGVLAPSDFLFLASSAPLLLAFVVRPDRPRKAALGFVFDLGLLVVFSLHTYVYFSLGYLIGGQESRYHEWLNALGNLDSALVLVVVLWAIRRARPPWQSAYCDLALVCLMLHGGSTLSSYLVLLGDYRPGLYDLPWVLPFVWLSFVGFEWRAGTVAVEDRTNAPDFIDTRRGLVLAILAVVAVPALHLVTELVTTPPRDLSRLRHFLTLLTAILLGALFLARQLVLLRRTEALHLEREKSLKRLFDSNPLPQFLCENEGLRILEVNRAAERAYGYSREEFLEMSLSALHPEGELPTLESSMDEATGPGRDGRLSGDWHHRSLDRQVRVVELTARALELGLRDVLLVVVADVTAHRDLEERLRHSQKMEALGRLAGGVAHDFNNLLTAILGYCSLLGMKLRETSLLVFLREIEKSGERAAALTRQLLAFSRKQMMVPQVLDLGVVLRELRMMLRPLLSEDIELSIDIANDLKPVRADRGQIEQVFLNLVVNARDAMPRGGKLGVALYNECAASGPGSIVLLVTDTGTGMTPAVRSRVFEPFFTTKAEGKGTGLGLATVYGIVTQSGGTVSLDSEPGQGSRFVVRLPLSEEIDSIAPPKQETSAAPAGSANILLVEDEETVRSLTARVLEEQGHRVLVAANGPEALALAGLESADIDLVVTDVIMPGMKGPELVAKLLELRPSLKVLYVSGYAADSLGLGGRIDGEIPFLPKPFTASVLARRVREVLDVLPHRARV
jgi:two-component system, cell cycle sensor histidine kinase and response regulator CckA